MTTGANVQVLYYWKHKKMTIMGFFSYLFSNLQRSLSATLGFENHCMEPTD